MDVFQEKVDVPSDFERSRLGVIVVETNVSALSNQSFQALYNAEGELLETELVTGEVTGRVSGASLLLPNSFVDDVKLPDETTVRFGYTIILSNTFFPSNPHSRLGANISEGNLTVGSVVIAATAVGLGNRTGNLSSPVVITFEKPDVSITLTLHHLHKWNNTDNLICTCKTTYLHICRVKASLGCDNVVSHRSYNSVIIICTCTQYHNIKCIINNYYRYFLQHVRSNGSNTSNVICVFWDENKNGK